MTRHFTAAVSAALLCIGAWSQDGARTGWDIVPLPLVSYNSDLGMQYGAYAEMFDYGRDVSVYPAYRHKYHIEGSRFTKGQTLLHAEYDSRYLIPGIRLTASASWQDDPLYPFYGLNGSTTEFRPELNLNDGTAYYSYKRSMLRMLGTIKGEIVSGLEWSAGLAYWKYSTADIDFEGYDSANTLYRTYRDAGVIRDDETGGSVVELKAGITYDTRDFEADPSEGCYAELYLISSPDLMGTGYSYLRMSARYRHFFRANDWLTFGMHAAWQGRIIGNVPFYMQQVIYTPTVMQGYAEGLGGINTVRGLPGTRLIGDGMAWANLELRIRLLEADLLGQHWKFGINPLLDCGVITTPTRAAQIADLTGLSISEISKETRRMHPSAGFGIKVAMNYNFILSAEWAKALADRFDPGISLFIGYIF